ncbi:hypothetical protein [Bacillus taeanensis]|uniref:DUF3993 domain-containing protein n=1 Tax=Bacillus taeanensis TaxID=273032 RepID=A0A366Y0L7_9BACI|nr:hypothetical protein [Bacillus taeanensis]RBW71388.1 hypothetical protein DS031_01165 [Bacillus taeanensis]
MNRPIQISFVAFLFIALSGCNGFEQIDWKQELTTVEQAAEAKANEQKIEQPPVEELAKEFINRLVQEVDHNYKVKDFTSKQALIDYMSEIVSEDAAEKVVSFYYKEKKDGLYIVPTELMPWFVEENEYKLERLDHQTYQLKQMNESNLYGNYEITIMFTYEHQHWKIKSFHIKQHTA